MNKKELEQENKFLKEEVEKWIKECDARIEQANNVIKSFQEDIRNYCKLYWETLRENERLKKDCLILSEQLSKKED